MTRRALAVTTAGTATEECTGEARRLAAELSAEYIERGDRTLAETADAAGATRLLIVERRELRLYDRDSETGYAYHPNLLPVRAAALLRGEPDLFVRTLDLSPGDHVLDCTLGFGAEASLAAYIVGASGSVVGLESVPELAAVTRAGMQFRALRMDAGVAAAVRRVQVVTAEAGAYLASCAARSFDTVYFDPFFGERLRGSECSVGPLALFGDTRPLSPEAIREARRVARKQVVVKTPKADSLPPEIANAAARVVTTHKSRVAFTIFMPFGKTDGYKTGCD